MESTGTFRGWIREGDRGAIEAMGLPKSGQISAITRSFEWTHGGGICYEGLVDIF